MRPFKRNSNDDSGEDGDRSSAARKALGEAAREGSKRTASSAGSGAAVLGRRIGPALAAGFALFFEVLGFIIRVLAVVLGAVWVVAGPLLKVLGRMAASASETVTPARVLALVVAGAAVLLALSQFADFRGVSIGTDTYTGVETVAPPPQVDRLQTGDAHSYAFLPVAALCLLMIPFILGGRWRLCRLVALAGIAAIVVAIVVDRPAGLDPGDTALAFEGVSATLLGGFYAQIAAGALLTASALLLGREMSATAGSRARGGRSPGRAGVAARLRGRRRAGAQEAGA